MRTKHVSGRSSSPWDVMAARRPLAISDVISESSGATSAAVACRLTVFGGAPGAPATGTHTATFGLVAMLRALRLARSVWT